MIGELHLQTLIEIGDYLAKGGDKQKLSSEHGISSHEINRAEKIYPYKLAIAECKNVVQALQVVDSLKFKIRNKRSLS